MGALLSEPVDAMVVEKASTPAWSVAVATMQGWRKTHEDAHVLLHSAGGAEESAVFAVLDGHGGDACAIAGSGMLEKQLANIAQRGSLSSRVAEDLIKTAFIDTDAELRGHLPQEDRSGSTVVAAIVTQPRKGEFCVQLAHSGDSRAVLCKGGRDLVCTDDHKPQREDETARIVAAGGTVEQGPLGGGPMRVDGALAVSRALGDFLFKPVDSRPEDCKVTGVPEVQTVADVSAGDWLLLACDGVFDVMESEDVRQFIATRLAVKSLGQVDGEQIVKELLSHCLEKGSKDNCTACLVQFLAGSSSNGSPAPKTRTLSQGSWSTAAPDVKAKFADFFAAEGFDADAAAVRETLPPPGSAADRSPLAEGLGLGAGVQSAQAAALIQAMRMRASRSIQATYRNRPGEAAASPEEEGDGGI